MSVAPSTHSTAAVSVSPGLSRHDRTSPWPVTPPAGRFVNVASGPPSMSAPSPSRYVQPHLLHYLVQQHHPGSTGYGSSRPSTAAGSSYQPSSPSSSLVFYHGRPSGTQPQPAAGPPASHPASHPINPTHCSSAVRWTDWRCGLRPSGAVSFKAVVDGDDSRSSPTEDHSSYQQYEPTGGYQHNRLI